MCELIEEYGLELKAEGRTEGILEVLRRFVEEGKLTAQEAVEKFGLPEDYISVLSEGIKDDDVIER